VSGLIRKKICERIEMKRYDVFDDYELESSDGYWCKWEDVKQLLSENEKLKETTTLQQEIGRWGEDVFGKSQSVRGLANHIVKEAYELRDSNDPEEAADCLILLFQHAHECGYDLFEEVKKKHKINLKRKWGKPDKYGIIEHINKEE